MSRIGNAPIQIPNNVTITLDDGAISVSGPAGQLSLPITKGVKVEVNDQTLTVKRHSDDRFARSLHGLTRALINNMVVGVDKGWEKKLELVGVGYRSQTSGDKITLSVGYSHPVEITAPAGIKFAVADNTKITVSGIDKNLVGQIAAKIRAVRPPEPYQGKGIRYAGEYVRRKAGKAAKVGGAK